MAREFAEQLPSGIAIWLLRIARCMAVLSWGLNLVVATTWLLNLVEREWCDRRIVNSAESCNLHFIIYTLHALVLAVHVAWPLVLVASILISAIGAIMPPY
jgi:hypothetical protein